VLQIAAVKDAGGQAHESEKSSSIYLWVEPLADASGLPASARGSAEPLSAARSETPAPGLAPATLAVDILATGLDAPSALATTPDGRIFIAERSGALRVWQSGQLRGDPAIVLPDAASLGDAGLIGLTVHPDFATNHLVYVVYTQRSDTGTLANRVVRYRELNNVFAQAAVLLEDAASELPVRASRIKFGPDRKLYVSFAAGTDRSAADSFASYVGKILRLNDDGSTPSDNPGGSPVIAYGHRAPTAFAWQPLTGAMWLTERDWADRDELERMPLGTPTYQLDPVDPSGATFLSTSAVSGFKDGLFIAAFGGQHIRQVWFDAADPTRVLATARLVDHEFGRISDVVGGSDGALYFCTSVSPGTSQSQGSDRLVRLVPLAPTTPIH
jgi:glucose/arabinose dehydrogenase